jgi:hypothetical protein
MMADTSPPPCRSPFEHHPTLLTSPAPLRTQPCTHTSPDADQAAHPRATTPSHHSTLRAPSPACTCMCLPRPARLGVRAGAPGNSGCVAGCKRHHDAQRHQCNVPTAEANPNAHTPRGAPRGATPYPPCTPPEYLSQIRTCHQGDCVGVTWKTPSLERHPGCLSTIH